MPSQKTLIWAGAAVATLVVAGAGGGALVWTHPSFVRPDPDSTAVEARAPERVTPNPPPAPSVGQPAAPAAGNETAALPPAAKPAPVEVATPSAEPPAIKPSFDVVTVEPTGEAVIAGRAAPNAKVELRDAGKTVAEATADASGQFVMIPPTLAPGDHSLSLAAGMGQAGPETSNAVAVSVPLPKAAAPPPAQTVTAAPSPPVLAMRTLATSPTTAASRVVIQSVEGDGAGGLVAKGSAEPNSLVRLYLNGAELGDAKPKSDGRWSLAIRRGVAPGAYSVRAEQVNPPGVTVVASAEIRFDYPTAPASAIDAAKNPPATQSNGPSPADVVVDSIQTAPVVSGHTLWALSQNYYGDPTRYPLIYEANKAEIHNPNLIFPGQVFVVPKFAAKP
jgi:nucleoid-associated protein YgaU